MAQWDYSRGSEVAPDRSPKLGGNAPEGARISCAFLVRWLQAPGEKLNQQGPGKLMAPDLLEKGTVGGRELIQWSLSELCCPGAPRKLGGREFAQQGLDRLCCPAWQGNIGGGELTWQGLDGCASLARQEELQAREWGPHTWSWEHVPLEPVVIDSEAAREV